MSKVQEGGNILHNLVNLGMPIGLSIIAAKGSDIDNKDKKTSKSDDSQLGGDILSNNLFLEFGLSVVPFGLISLIDFNSKEDKSIKKNTQSTKKK